MEVQEAQVEVDAFIYGSQEFEDHLQQSDHLRGEVELLRSITQPGMTAVDVGANRGISTVALAAAVGREGRVYAFEPVPQHYTALQASLVRNHVANVVASPEAIGDEDGMVEVYERGGGSGIVASEDAEVFEVRRVTLDGFLKRRGVRSVDVLNADCEGSELLMLRGASEILKAHQPQVFCEVHHDFLQQLGQSAGDVIECLEGFGYAVTPMIIEEPQTDASAETCTHVYAYPRA
jgi:FkbM family methyltransferase